jgi:hypothetical protein
MGAAVTGSGNLDATSHGLAWAADTNRAEGVDERTQRRRRVAPLTERTRGIIGPGELRALGPSGVLVNAGRGPLVQEGRGTRSSRTQTSTPPR